MSKDSKPWRATDKGQEEMSFKDTQSAQTVLRRRSGRRVARSTLLPIGNKLPPRPPPSSVQLPQANPAQHNSEITNSSITRAESPEQLSCPPSSDADFDIGHDIFRTSSPDPEPVICHPQKRIRVSSRSHCTASNLTLIISGLGV